MEVVARHVARGESGVEGGVPIKQAGGELRADLGKGGVVVDVPLADGGAALDVSRLRRGRVGEERLADVGARPHEAGEEVVLEQAPQLIDVRDADHVYARAGRSGVERGHGRLELVVEDADG